MNELIPIEHSEQRILTTQQIAENYGTEAQVITNNFNRNKERYILGKHYFALEGAEKQDFLNLTHNDLGSAKNAKTLYLWTEKGAFLHAKSLNTDKAWEVYDHLVESYFRTRDNAIPKSLPEALRLAADLAEKNQTLMLEAERKDQIIGELQPKADYVDYILSCTGAMATTQIAADYGMSANKLNKILKEEKIQRHVCDQWVLYKEHMGQGYTKSETIPITRSDGRPDTRLFTKWTQKGRLMINEVLNRRGVYANMDIVGYGKHSA